VQSVNLLSERFENAAFALQRSLDSFASSGSFEESVRIFQGSVDKLVRAMSMQAENQRRERNNDAQAYTEYDFSNL
jgi:hypothetical protein